MKRFCIIVIPLILSACQPEYKPREMDQLQIESFAIDSTSIRAIDAIDNNTMYFAGSNGIIGYTKDRAKNLTVKQLIYQDSLKPYFRSIAFNKASNGLFALSIGNPALLYHYDFKTATVVYSEYHEKVFYDSMQFFDALNGIAMGDPTEDCLSILLTHDGGKSWRKISCKNLPKVEEGEAAFAASNTNIKVLNNTVWIATGGARARVFKSTDFGKSWRVFNTPIVQGNGPQGIYSIDFADENQGIIIGGDYSKPEENKANVAITKDGGQTWELVADGEYPNYKSCVQFVPNTQGKEVFAVGKTGVSYSNDGGMSWKHLSDDAYYTIEFADKNNAWLAGNKKIGRIALNGK